MFGQSFSVDTSSPEKGQKAKSGRRITSLAFPSSKGGRLLCNPCYFLSQCQFPLSTLIDYYAGYWPSRHAVRWGFPAKIVTWWWWWHSFVYSSLTTICSPPCSKPHGGAQSLVPGSLPGHTQYILFYPVNISVILFRSPICPIVKSR